MNINIYPIKQLILKLKDVYIEWLDKNDFGFENELIENSKRKFETLKIHINECWILENKDHMSLIEEKVMINKTYIDSISNLYQDKMFRLFRNDEVDYYNRDYVSILLVWNAWYDYTSNSVNIPPGLLNTPVNILKYESCAFKSYIGSVSAHELFHMIYLEIKETKSVKWKKFVTHMIDSYGETTLFENLADVIGVYSNYQIFISKRENERQCFFLTYIRLWCSNQRKSDHSSGKNRARMMFELLRHQYEGTFNCKF